MFFRPNNSLLLAGTKLKSTCKSLEQGCQKYGPRAKSGPLRGWIRPAGSFCEIKTFLFA